MLIGGSVVEVFPATHLFPAIDDAAKQIGSLLGVVAGRVGLTTVEVDTGCLAGFGQYRLTVGQAGKGRGVEAGERVERIALHVQTRNRGIQEAKVETAVVADQDQSLKSSQPPICFQRLTMPQNSSAVFSVS